MGLDLKKMRALQADIHKKAQEEMMENISENLINFVLDDDIADSFKKEKGRRITEQSKRVIGHWVKEGVITGEQHHEGGWFYFDRTESIWIDIVTHLRGFGLSLKIIKTIREKLFNEVQPGFRMIDFAIIHSVLRSHYIMMVNPNGSINLTTSWLYSETVKKEVLPPHIMFNFFHLAKEIFPNNNFDVAIADPDKLPELTDEEMKILYYIRTGDFKEIKIKMQEGEVYLLEAQQEMQVNEKLINIISKAAYQDISIKIADNKIVHITRTERFKP
ncbi:MerR family transcriptional regulator [Chryseobacterium sp. SC28]|uniref:MerR family transcriptional regulator n=1 Tax=Chryseobacterium sp. SC28 TaxID=2268028 RepID=UPI000F64ABF2|nr:MerR family transcriptional regulator [Chryseobacterium sp. SC28]RRQ46494.1 MerR family transcriptional regulator [Chryseobacterium sp. SC28]